MTNKASDKMDVEPPEEDTNIDYFTGIPTDTPHPDSSSRNSVAARLTYEDDMFESVDNMTIAEQARLFREFALAQRKAKVIAQAKTPDPYTTNTKGSERFTTNVTDTIDRLSGLPEKNTRTHATTRSPRGTKHKHPTGTTVRTRTPFLTSQLKTRGITTSRHNPTGILPSTRTK